MVQLDGKYELTGHEGFVEYLTSLGPELTQETAEKIAGASSTLSVKREGNKVALVDVSGPSTNTKIFTLDQFFEEDLLRIVKVQTIASIDGNRLRLKATGKDGRTGERVYEFFDDGLTIIYTSFNSNVIGRRFYRRI